MKIPLSHLFQSYNRYYSLASDKFVVYALTELAGSAQTQYIPHFFYYSNQNPIVDECQMSKTKAFEYKAHAQTPLLPLSSLKDEVKITPGYFVPQANIANQCSCTDNSETLAHLARSPASPGRYCHKLQKEHLAANLTSMTSL